VARTAITPQVGTSAGAAVTFEAANALGNSFRPARGRAVHVKNGSVSSMNVTLPTPATADGLAVADRVIAVAAGAHTVVALGAASGAGIYAQPDGSVNLDYSAVTSVTVAVVDQP
jgi:hypothetical protein